MKNLTVLALGGIFFLASCSTGNMSFSKRKYTKGKYKPEKSDYKVAKSSNKTEDTKYVVKTEKNPSKQSYKVSKSKVKKEEQVAKNNAAPVFQKEAKVSRTEEVLAQNKNNSVVQEDGITEVNTERKQEQIIENVSEAAPVTPEPAPAGAGEILGYIGFGFGLLAVLLAVLGWLTLGLAYAALALGIIGLGTSIASWVIDGQSMWNLWGTISSAVAIVLAIIFMILWFVIFI
ncbi:MAG: hypothetical protein R2799_00380 [Crocinitomicaceae bacterium]